MKTEEALDLAYDNPFLAITTEDLYGFNGEFFYYDNEGNLKNRDAQVINEDKLYKLVKGSEDEDFNDWIEIEVEISENTNIDSPSDYFLDDEDEWN